MTRTSAVPASKGVGEWISYEDFLAAYMGENAEWVDGRVENMSPINLDHDSVSGWLYKVMSELAQILDLGVVLHDKFQMKTGAHLAGREPDIMFVAKANLHRLHRTFLDGPADLVIEIISEDSGERDRVTKYLEYERGGVGEYWLLDPEQQTQEFLALGADGRFVPVLVSEDGVYRSAVLPQFWIRTEWLWQKPRLTMVDVLKIWGLL